MVANGQQLGLLTGSDKTGRLIKIAKRKQMENISVSVRTAVAMYSFTGI